MKRDCARVQPLLSAAARGELDEIERATVTDHMTHCADCASAYAFEQSLQASLEAAEPGPPPLYFESVLAEIHRQMPRRVANEAPRRRRWGRQQWASACMFAMFAVWGGAISVRLGAAQWLEREAGGGLRAVQTQGAHAMAAVRKPVSRMVAMDGLGLVSEDSPLWSLPPAMRKEIVPPSVLPRKEETGYFMAAWFRRPAPDEPAGSSEPSASVPSRSLSANAILTVEQA